MNEAGGFGAASQCFDRLIEFCRVAFALTEPRTGRRTKRPTGLAHSLTFKSQPPSATNAVNGIVTSTGIRIMLIRFGWTSDISCTDRPPPISEDKMAQAATSFAGTIPSALNVGLRSITAWRPFIVPTTILVFVRNARRFSRNDLLLRCAICRFASQVMSREGLGVHPIDLIGPTTIMFDNLIDYLCHVSLLTSLGGLIVDQASPVLP
jgi:hypothetical protein